MSLTGTIVLIVASFVVVFVALVRVFKANLLSAGILCTLFALVSVFFYVLYYFSMNPAIQTGVSAF